MEEKLLGWGLSIEKKSAGTPEPSLDRVLPLSRPANTPGVVIEGRGHGGKTDPVSRRVSDPTDVLEEFLKVYSDWSAGSPAEPYS